MKRTSIFVLLAIMVGAFCFAGCLPTSENNCESICDYTKNACEKYVPDYDKCVSGCKEGTKDIQDAVVTAGKLCVKNAQTCEDVDKCGMDIFKDNASDICVEACVQIMKICPDVTDKAECEGTCNTAIATATTEDKDKATKCITEATDCDTAKACLEAE